MPAQASTEVVKRIPLTRDRVLRGALTVADAAGLGSLTMRSLAEELGVKPMAVYHHVKNKEEILDGIIDAVFSEIDLPPSELPWRPALRHRSCSARRVLAQHPWATPLMESRLNAGPATLRHHDAVLGTMRRAGFSIVMTAHAYSVLDSYIYGFALQEAGLPFDSPESAAEMGRLFLEHFPAKEFPYLAECTVKHILREGYDYSEEFEFGLDLVLDGIEQALTRKGARRKER
jgi:AcrR family transcriptional regulator